MFERGMPDNRRSRRVVGVIEHEHRTPSSKEPAGLKADAQASATHLHAAGISLMKLATHHLRDQFGAVKTGAVVRVGDPFGKNADAGVDERAVRKLNRLEASGAELTTDRAAEIDLHGRSALPIDFERGRAKPTASRRMPSTGSKGSTIPPSRAPSQRGLNRRMRGLSAIRPAGARLAVRNRVRRLILDVDPFIPRVITPGWIVTFLAACRPLRGQRSYVESLAQQVNALQQRQPLDQPSDAIMDGEPGFVRGRMAVPAAPTSHGFLETRRKAAFAAVLGSAGAQLSLRDAGMILAQLRGL